MTYFFTRLAPAGKRGSALLLAITAALLVACSSNNSSSANNKPVASAAASVVATRAAASAAATATTTAASSPAAAAAPVKATHVIMQVNWFSQPENAGELMAKLLGYYPPSLDVEVRDGGPSVNLLQLLTTGQIQFATCSADQVLTFKAQGVDLVGLMAAFQTSPSVLIAHKEAGLTGFQDMKGKTVAVSSQAVFWDYLAKKYGWSTADKGTYSGSVAPFLADKNLIQQGFYTNEPYLIQKAGEQTDVFLVSSAGYNPYSAMLCTTKDFLTKNPDVVKAFVQADQKGWQALVKPENQQMLKDEIKRRSPDETDDIMSNSLAKMPDLMFSDDTKANAFGYMSDERWQTLMNQMVDLGVLKAPVDYKSCYTDQFLLPN